MKAVASLVLATSLAGCTLAYPEPVAVSSAFNPAEVAWYSTPGTNTIEGNAVMRTVGGDVRTCAGLDANLVPVSTYAEERFQKMYGNTASGYLSADSGFQFTSTDPEYQRLSRTIKCDSEGNFTFRNVPDGEYFVTALVTWGVPTQYFTDMQGGYLMQRVAVSGGETERLVLTP